MNFVQIQQITMPENVGCIIGLIAYHCYKGFGHTGFGASIVNLCMVLYLTFRGMCSCELILLCVMVAY